MLLHVIVAGFVLACAITTFVLVVRGLRQVRVEEPVSDLRLVGGPHSAGRSVRAMAIPRKHPAIRTRHARSLK